MSNILRYLEQLSVEEDQDMVVSYIHDLLKKNEAEDQQKDPESSPKHQEDPRHETNMSKLLQKISKSPLLAAYKLQPSELRLIANICQKTKTSCEQDFNVREICEMMPGLDENMDKQYATIVDLIDREILSAPRLHGQDYHYDLRGLYDASFRLNGLLWNLILGKDPIKEALKAHGKGLANPESAVDAVLKMIGVLFLHYPELTDELSSKTGVCFGRNVNLGLDSYLKALNSSKSAPLWQGFCSRHKLNVFWQKSLLLIDYFNREQESEVSHANLASLLATNPKERERYHSKLFKDNLLCKKGLINPRIPVFSVYLMDLTSSTVSALHGKGSAEADRQKRMNEAFTGSQFLTRIDPTQSLDQLILDSSTRELIVTVVKRLQNPNLENIADWGLVGASLTGDKGVQHGCNILLYGSPGTGKTFIAGVIANELKRPLVQINANAIRGMYYGESEKQARELFKEMREAVKILSPVFLLNEGDQLIHRRLESAERSGDHAENSIQSVFLEEMETFPGILIITTNLVENLDLAMSRRLHYKLKITAPDYTSRVALWRLHLPATIPGAQDIAVEGLANDFCFTGGQIRLVVQNACHEAFLRGKGARLTLNDLRKYAVLEGGTSFERARQGIGFAISGC